ncbi:PolC-type DNA polymerase III [Streptobacillus moniliformis]|uniref:PolC-type DNA polymerase III n=1 Tax=Streptobacillus moniliformis TaxID=34105 RepID=UPI0007E39C9E|nr:PolC-type DNA polymerase III [Streptobacillus moniliformis]
MKKGYTILTVNEDSLGISNIKITEIALLRSKVNEVIINYDILNIENVFDDLLKIRRVLEKVSDTLYVKFNINTCNKDKFNIDEVINFTIKLIRDTNPYLSSILSNYTYTKLQDNIKLNLETIMNIGKNTEKNISKKIEKIINETFSQNLNFEIFFDVNTDQNVVNIQKQEQEEILEYEIPISYKPKEVKKPGIVNNKKYSKSKLKLSKFSDIEDLMVGQEIALRGDIFYFDLVATKSGKLKIVIYITDYENSVACTKFVNDKEEIKFKIGDSVELSGKYEKYFDDYSIIIRDIKVVEGEENKREDNASEKRIELAAHTNMSDMLSTIEPKSGKEGSLVNRAREFGHKAVAVTDYGVVHAFPFVATGIKEDEEFKVIYGMEAYMVDDSAPLIVKAKDVFIEEEEFVVFDIETTGFSPINDKIIEIGAVKLKNGKVLDRFSEFVNPQTIIPKKIVELTGINDNMVKDSDIIDKVMPRFLEFVKGTTLVAHNAKFDVGFISKKCEDLNLETDFSYIDTLEWSKILVDDVKRFNLDTLTKRFNIKLENHHRAVDDANATAELFKKLLSLVSANGVEKLTDVSEKLEKKPKIADTENITILVKNLAGLKRLYELVSISHLKYYGEKKPRILKTDLEKDRENFLISSSPIYSGRFNKGKLVSLYVRGISREEIMQQLDFYDYVQVYPRCIYNDAIEMEEISGYEFIEQMNKDFVQMAKEKNKLVVATGNVYYLDDRDKKSKAALLLGSDRAFRTYQIDTGNYYRTTEEMLDEFSYLNEEDIKDVVIYNTHKINDQIEKIKPIPDGDYKPVMEGAEDEVRNMTYNKAYELYGNPLPEAVETRVKRELDSIIGNGFAVLYLIAQKLVKKSVDNGYLVGSRGSVGSSLVAYFMGITEVNALYPHYRCKECKYFEMKDFEGSGVDLEEKNCPKCNSKLIRDGHSIPFEVFMGFKGDKTPDIDLNFSGEYQGEIHKYTKELFGDDYVFRAGTISGLAEKNAYTTAKKYFEENIKKDFEKEIYNKYKTSLKKLDPITRSSEEKKLEERINDYCNKNKAEIYRIATKCTGARKTTGQHPGGMIVVPDYKSIYDFTPVQYPANDESSGSITTHFDYHVMDQQLVKLDILGHDDPTTLRMLQDLTNVDIYNIPLTDPKVISIFNSTEALGVSEEQIGSKMGTNGIPEFGTDFVKKMLEDTLPTTFAELVRISGLSHGTDVWLNNAQEYVREGIATLSEVITVRDDIMNRLIDKGMDKSEAFNIMEFVRKGQPSKNKEKWEQYKEIMKASNIDEWYIESCEKIKYMFPKGHAVAYVMMAVRIAYFKVFYPLEFYTAFLNRKYADFSFEKMFGSIDEVKMNLQKLKELETRDLKVLDKKQIILLEILVEMHYRGIELLNIDIYKSDSMKFTIEDGKIRLPLIAMDQLGEVVARTIAEEREIKEFTSIEDLTKRCRIPKTVLETLKCFGCIGEMPESNQLTLF